MSSATPAGSDQPQPDKAPGTRFGRCWKKNWTDAGIVRRTIVFMVVMTLLSSTMMCCCCGGGLMVLRIWMGTTPIPDEQKHRHRDDDTDPFKPGKDWKEDEP